MSGFSDALFAADDLDASTISGGVCLARSVGSESVYPPAIPRQQKRACCVAVERPPRGRSFCRVCRAARTRNEVRHSHGHVAIWSRSSTPAVEAAGYRLVRLRLMGGKRKTLQIMAERAGRHDECRGLREACPARCPNFSKREDPIEGEYRARSVVARHRPAADAPHRLRALGRPRSASIELDRAGCRAAASGSRASLLGLDGSDVVIEVGRRAR